MPHENSPLSAISTSDLVKVFATRAGPLTAVDHISLSIAPGETFGLIGPDGAGKTTTLRLLLGLLRRTSGSSSILGFDSMRDTYVIREKVGYIAQQFSLPADLTVMENMLFFARIHSLSAADQHQRIPELLELAGLVEFTSRQAGKLSGGMKKKLALACSLVHAPLVVVLDEPTLGVDPVSRREFWTLLGNLRVERGLTVFVCTPYMDEAERCNTVGLLYAGRLIANDTPAGIKRLVPGKLLEFTPLPFVPARDAVKNLPGVVELQTYGAMLHVFVDDPDLRRPQIESALEAQGIQVSGMRPIQPRMEEAFISLVNRQSAGNQEVRES
jgi:ABC-2 type transport system ATP-binding protein